MSRGNKSRNFSKPSTNEHHLNGGDKYGEGKVPNVPLANVTDNEVNSSTQIVNHDNSRIEKGRSKKARRNDADLQAEYQHWLELYHECLSPCEITERLGITDIQFKIHLATAIMAEDTAAITPKNLTCRAKDFPKEIQKMLGIDGTGLVKYTQNSEGEVVLKPLNATIGDS